MAFMFVPDMETPPKFLLIAVIILIAGFVVHAQDDQSGFISLDCGSPENYTDEITGINYSSDWSFIESGASERIATADSVARQFRYLREFRGPSRNCYILRPVEGKGNNYLIRASFLYGNYDSLSQLPTFDLHLGTDYWTTISFSDAITATTVEIIHIPPKDDITICLVKTGISTPFISSLELRTLDNYTYTTKNGSLELVSRLYFNDEPTQSVRYKNDIYDRMWLQYGKTNAEGNTLSTEAGITPNYFQVPSGVMRSAWTPLDSSWPLQLFYNTRNTFKQYYLYMHFTEVVLLQANETREMNIYLNDELYYGPVVPPYLSALTIYTTIPESGKSIYTVTLNKTANSTLPPIINAVEFYTVRQFLHMETEDTDVSAMLRIKAVYNLTRNWQGDPCKPQAFAWEGLTCSYNDFKPPRITSLLYEQY